MTDSVVVLISLDEHSEIFCEISFVESLIYDYLKNKKPKHRKYSSGTYGNVYKIRNNIVVKMVDIYGEVNDNIMDNNLRELSFLSQYRHPMICKMYGFNIIEGKIHIALEKGNSMDSCWDKFPYVKRIRMLPCILFDLICAIKFLADHELYHQDIKFSNVIFTGSRKNYIVKLIDFGGINFPGNYQEHSYCTRNTRAPEAYECDCRGVCKGYCNIFSPAGDVFSVGMTCLDWLVKKELFRNNEQRKKFLLGNESMMSLKTHEIEVIKCSLAKYLPDVIHILDRMTCLNYKNRITANELYYLPYFDHFREEFENRYLEDTSIPIGFNDKSIYYGENKCMRMISIIWIKNFLKDIKKEDHLNATLYFADHYLNKTPNLPITDFQEVFSVAMMFAMCVYDSGMRLKNVCKLSNISKEKILKRIEDFLIKLDGKLFHNYKMTE